MRSHKDYVSAFLGGLLFFILACCNTPDVDRYDPIDGELSGMGTGAPVKVVRDHAGVVHLEAEDDADLFFALGYSMAQDRFMQMDMFRRASAGTLSELVGDPARVMGVGVPNIDIMLRTFQFAESAEKAMAGLDPESRRQLESFVGGINRYLDDGGDSLSYALTMGTEPEPWTIEDTFITSGVMGLAMNYGTFLEEYYLERVRREHGEDMRDLFVGHYPDQEVIITRDQPLIGAAPSSMLPSPLDGVGSNNWAVSGRRSLSGKPILCNDPHVPHTIAPTFWYHVHLKSPSYDVMGMMFSGFPCFGAAINGKLGWTLTNVGMDYIDIWREKINPNNPDEYRYGDEWLPFETARGEVEIQGKRPLRYEMRKTVHGVVIDKDLLGWRVPAEPGEVLVMRFVDVDFARYYRGYQAMAKAGNYRQWLAGAADMSMGPFAWNHTYADVTGNIAYHATGHIPIRKDNQGYIARKGWDPEQDWQGYLPFEQNPKLVNPNKGYIVTANNRVQTPDYPHYITSSYSGPSRARRITELIEEKDRLGVDDMKRIQYDTAVLSARGMVPMILEDLEGAKCGSLKLAAEILEEWRDQGYPAEVDTRGVCLYEVWRSNFTGAVFDDELGFGTISGLYLSLAGIMENGLNKIIDDPDHEMFDNRKTLFKKETRADVTRKVIKDAVKYLRKELGRDPKKWEWGKLSTLTLSPAFLAIPGITAEFSSGPHPLAGTGETVNAANHVFLGGMGFMGFVGPSTRFIVDFANPRRAYFNATAGNADNPKHERYNNLMPLWLDGEYLVISMEPDEYRRGMMGELVLSP